MQTHTLQFGPLTAYARTNYTVTVLPLTAGQSRAAATSGELAREGIFIANGRVAHGFLPSLLAEGRPGTLVFDRSEMHTSARGVLEVAAAHMAATLDLQGPSMPTPVNAVRARTGASVWDYDAGLEMGRIAVSILEAMR